MNQRGTWGRAEPTALLALPAGDRRAALAEATPVATRTADAERDARDAVPAVDAVVTNRAFDGDAGLALCETCADGDVPCGLLEADLDAVAALEAGAADLLDPAAPEAWLGRQVATLARAGAGEDLRGEVVELDSVVDGLLAHAPVSIYFKDRQARHVRISDHMLENLRLRNDGDRPGPIVEDRQDVLGLTDPELYGTDEAEQTYEDDLEIMETGEPIVEQEEGWLGDSAGYVSTTKWPWRGSDGEVKGLVGVTVDIRERRRNEELEQFAEVVSHDLRNPLNVAQAALSLAAEECDSDRLETVANAHDRMAALVENLLVQAREGRVIDDLETVSLADVAGEAWEGVRSPNAELAVEADQRLRADPFRLQQLLENLFRNAVEHGSTSSRSAADDAVERGSTSSRPAADDAVEHAGDGVTVRVTVADDGFAVVDDGPGFGDLDPSQATEWGYSTAGGSGYGLAIVGQIAEAHGWTVSIADAEDGGARVEIAGVERVASEPA